MVELDLLPTSLAIVWGVATNVLAQLHENQRELAALLNDGPPRWPVTLSLPPAVHSVAR